MVTKKINNIDLCTIIIKNKIILIYNIIIKKRSINNKYLIIKKIKYIMKNNIELIPINI